jgi:hypothetical protein
LDVIVRCLVKQAPVQYSVRYRYFRDVAGVRYRYFCDVAGVRYRYFRDVAILERSKNMSLTMTTKQMMHIHNVPTN